MENKIEELVIIEKTIGDSRGYLWKVIIDQHHSVARIEKVSGLQDSTSMQAGVVEGIEYSLQPNSSTKDHMQYLTGVIEARFQAA